MLYSNNQNEVYRICHKKTRALKPIPLPPQTPQHFKIIPPPPPTPQHFKIIPPTPQHFKIIPPSPPPTPQHFKIIPPPPPTPQHFKIIPPPPPTPQHFKIIPPPTPQHFKIIPPSPPPFKDDWNNIEKRFVWIREKWNILKKEYHLEGWVFHFNSRLRTTAGQCLYGRDKRVELATLLVNSPDIKRADILDTLLHEVAHAIAGYEAAHGSEWKKIAKKLGCSGNVCHSLSFGHHKAVAFLDCSVDCPRNHMTLFRTPDTNKYSRVFCGMCEKRVRLVESK